MNNTYDLMCINNENIRTDYVVNKDKRTVTCIISTINDYNRKLNKYNFEDGRKDSYYDDFNQYIGIARCNPEDTWDEVYGKRLAEYRASCQRRAALNHQINNFVKEINRDLNALITYGKLKPPHKPEER